MVSAGPCLHESGLTPKKFSYKDDAELVHYGIGLANLVPRTTASVEELSSSVQCRVLILLKLELNFKGESGSVLQMVKL